ncbi:MAG: class II aldolase [Chloroflexi bacterium]|nr:class II aldolase [Chloroflexota bacterium]
MQQTDVLAQLVEMSRTLGDPTLDYAILGEGNTSARADEETFWVKASGARLGTAGSEGYVSVRFDPMMEMLDGGDLSDDEIKLALEGGRADASATARPSTETPLHALALQLPGVNFVGHTHPTVVNAIMCSVKVQEAINGRLFPDMIVYCGIDQVYVPFTDPGLPLARAVRAGLRDFLERHGEPPKLILMQNHGMIALGGSPDEVINIHAMYCKAARVLVGAYALGGPHFLAPAQVERIHTRPDELYRRKEWGI